MRGPLEPATDRPTSGQAAEEARVDRAQSMMQRDARIEALARQGVRQEDIAREVGLSQARVSGILKDRGVSSRGGRRAGTGADALPRASAPPERRSPSNPRMLVKGPTRSTIARRSERERLVDEARRLAAAGLSERQIAKSMQRTREYVRRLLEADVQEGWVGPYMRRGRPVERYWRPDDGAGGPSAEMDALERLWFDPSLGRPERRHVARYAKAISTLPTSDRARLSALRVRPRVAHTLPDALVDIYLEDRRRRKGVRFDEARDRVEALDSARKEVGNPNVAAAYVAKDNVILLSTDRAELIGDDTLAYETSHEVGHALFAVIGLGPGSDAPDRRAPFIPLLDRLTGPVAAHVQQYAAPAGVAGDDELAGLSADLELDQRVQLEQASEMLADGYARKVTGYGVVDQWLLDLIGRLLA